MPCSVRATGFKGISTKMEFTGEFANFSMLNYNSLEPHQELLTLFASYYNNSVSANFSSDLAA